MKESAKRIYNNQHVDKRSLRGGEHGKQIIFLTISNLSNPQVRVIDMKTLVGNSLVFKRSLFILLEDDRGLSAPQI